MTLLGGNPVEAQDDFIDFPGDRDNLPLLRDDILGNDEPNDQIVFDGLEFSSTFFTLRDVPGGFNLLLDDPVGFFAVGTDVLEYRVCLASDPGICDSAFVHIRAVAVANPDEVFVALDPATAPLVIPAADLLADDGPEGHLQLLGASDGDHGRARRVGDTVVYTPLDSFWEVGSDLIAYQVSYDADPTAPAQASILVVAESGLEAVDDAFAQVPPTPDPQDPNCIVPALEFVQEDLLANDRPYAGELSIVSLQTTTAAGGSISAPGGPGFHYCPPDGWPAQGVDSASYTMRLRIGDTYHNTSGRVFFFPGAVPPLAAVADEVSGRAEEDLEIPFEDLLANDLGQGLWEVNFPSPPAHGTLVVGADSVTYRPESGFIGEDSFTYRVLDADGRESDRGRVSVAVELAARPDPFLVPYGITGLALPKASLLANDSPADLEVSGFDDGALGTVIDFGDTLVYQPGPHFWSAGSDAFTYTVFSKRGGASATALVHLEAAEACSDLIQDDFESGELDLWDAVSVVGTGSATVSPAAALEGFSGLAVSLPPQLGAPMVRLVENLPEPQHHIRGSFLLDASQLQMPAGAAFSLLDSLAGTDKPFAVQLVDTASGHALRLRVLDGGGTVAGPPVSIPQEALQVHVEWWASSAPGLTNGGARLWIDRRLVSEMLDLDTGAQGVTRLRLGAVAAVDVGTSGTLRFDGVEACGGSRNRQILHQDGFESGDLTFWDDVHVESGGNLSVAPAAALEGGFGLRVDLDGARQAWVEDRLPEPENHYWARFLLDTGSLRSVSPRPILKGQGTGGDAFRLSLSQSPDASQYFLGLEVSREFAPDLQLSPVTLKPGIHEVQVEWWSASDPNAQDGGARFWVDGVLRGTAQDVSNWNRLVEAVRWGSVESDEVAVRGSYSLDSFESWRGFEARTYRQVDDFETGDLSRWSEVAVSGSGSISASPSAALEGSFGLAAEIQSGDLFERVGTSWSEADRALSVRFAFDPNSLDVPPGNFTLLQVYGPQGSPMSLRIRRGAPGYHLRLVATKDDGTFANGSWQVVPDSPQTLTLEWRAATAPGSPDGFVRLWAGSTLFEEISSLENASQIAQGLRLGAVFGLDSGTVGVSYFDDVRVWK